MHKLGFAITLFLFSVHVAAEPCASPADPVGATYRVSSNVSGDRRTHTFTLWRVPGRVMHEFPEIRAAHLWQRGARGHVSLVRYFDDERHAIEYQPNDLASASQTLFDAKRDLVLPTQRAAMARKWQRGKGCAITEKYHLRTPGERADLIWDVHYGLPRRFTRKTDDGTWRFELLELVTGRTEVAAALARRDDYRVTDYVDIGDNETDPFLLRMVHLGFVDTRVHQTETHMH